MKRECQRKLVVSGRETKPDRLLAEERVSKRFLGRCIQVIVIVIVISNCANHSDINSHRVSHSDSHYVSGILVVIAIVVVLSTHAQYARTTKVKTQEGKR